MSEEKCLESIRVHLPDRLKHDLMARAAQEDRKLSELIRVWLEDRMYGEARHLCEPVPDRHERGR